MANGKTTHLCGFGGLVSRQVLRPHGAMGNLLNEFIQDSIQDLRSIQQAGGLGFNAAGYGPGSKGGRSGKGTADRGRIVASDMLHRRPLHPGLPGGAGHGHLGPSGVPAGGDQSGGGQPGPNWSASVSSYSGGP